MTGSLVLVGTPIGNLGDLSPRAVEALAGADVIACEDTRRTRSLLQHVGISVPKLIVVNDHTEPALVDRLIDRVVAGEQVVLVSDAGMPGVSDPGERVVAAAVAADVTVDLVPGPSAVLAALVLSGLATGRFFFEGFLPRKGSGRRDRLAAVAAAESTVVLFEAPHRLTRTLTELAEVAGGSRRVAVARELTKRFQEVHRSTLDEAIAWSEAGVRGEVAIVLDAAREVVEITDQMVLEALAVEVAGGASTRDAVAAVTALYGVPKRRVYDLATGPGR